MENTNKESCTIKLLLSLLRYSLGTISKQDLYLSFEQEIDWDLFNELISFHLVGALIRDRVDEDILNLLPQGATRLLRKIHRDNTVASLLLSSIIDKVFQEFKKNEIPVLLLKGKAVENWLYAKDGIRSSGDIDLFIHPKNGESAIICLKSMGFKTSPIADRLTTNSKLKKQFFKSTKDITFYDNNVTIELHWRMSPNGRMFPVSFNNAWENRHSFDYRGTEILSLSYDVHAIYLCFHVTMHRMEKLFWLYDIALLMKNENSDWHKILKQAKHLNAENSLSIACVMASKIFLVPIPSVICKQDNLLEMGMLTSEKIMQEVICEIPNSTTSTTSLLKKVTWRRHINPSESTFLTGWYDFLTTPSVHDWESINLPDHLTPLYRVWRPMRLLFKAFSSLKN